MADMVEFRVSALWPLLVACALVGVSPRLAAAQDSASVPDTQPADSQPTSRASALRAEIHMERTLMTPSQPAMARFMLINPTDESIEIPAPKSTDGTMPISLPMALILGDASQPALHVTLDNRTDPVRPPGLTYPPADGTMLLGPRGSIGMEIDLRTLARDARYTGRFKLEWKPPLGKGVTAITEFTIETRKRVIIGTVFGSMTFNLYYDKAPLNVENFLDLVRERFYDDKSFHRIVPRYILQGGSVDGLAGGQRTDGKTIPAEIHDVKFERGTLAMALKNLPNGAVDPSSASSQFFITLNRIPELDGKYTIIGQIADEKSMQTLEQIESQRVNEKGRPQQPIGIIFTALIDAEETGAKRLEFNRP